MRKLLFLLTFMSLPIVAEAQSTSVTLQVTDAAAQSWGSGSWSVLLVSQPGASTFGPPFNLVGGGTVPSQSQSGTLTGSGGASMTLTPNASITPAASQWKFTVCPGPNLFSQCFTQSVTIGGSSQTVTLTPPAASTTNPSGGSSVSPATAIYASKNCAPSNINNCYFVNDNVQFVFDCTFTAGTNVVSCPSAVFTAQDVGKWAQGTCCVAWQATAITAPRSTITAFNSSTSVTVSTTVSAGTPGQNMFAWGTDDSANLTAACNAAGTTASKNPATLILPSGAMFVSSAPCVFTAARPYSISIIGQGAATVIIPTTDFDFLTCRQASDGGCIFHDSAGGLGSPLNDNDLLQNWTIWGMGNPVSVPNSSISNKTIVNVPALSMVSNLSIVGWGWAFGGAFGFGGIIGGEGTLIQGSIINGGGKENCIATGTINGNETPMTLSGSFCGAGNHYPLIARAGAVISYGSTFWGVSAANTIGVYVNGAGAFWKSNDDVVDGIIYADGGGIAKLHHDEIFAGAASFGALNNVGGIITADTTTFNNSAGVSILQSSGSFTDLGGNGFPNGKNISGGSIFGSASITGTTLVAGNLVPSANWGTSAAISAPLGDSQNFSFTLTNGSAAVGANPTIAFTYPTAFLKTPICTIQQVGGTQAILAATVFLTPSAGSATTVTLTYNGTPTVNLTEFYQGGCH